MPLELYRALHFLGLFMVFTALGALALHAANGGTRESNTARGLVGALHGVGLLLVLVAGFGMLAKRGMTDGVPGWAWAKLGIWFLLGAAAALPVRRPSLGRPMLVLVPLLGLVAVLLVLYRPF